MSRLMTGDQTGMFSKCVLITNVGRTFHEPKYATKIFLANYRRTKLTFLERSSNQKNNILGTKIFELSQWLKDHTTPAWIVQAVSVNVSDTDVQAEEHLQPDRINSSDFGAMHVHHVYSRNFLFYTFE